MQLSKARQKYVRSLRQKKYRQKYNKFLAEGDKIVAELIAQKAVRVDGIFALSAWAEANPAARRLHPGTLEVVDEKTLADLSSLNSPNQVIAVAETPQWEPDWPILSQDLALYLDGLRDPGNLGAILRVADWFGIKWVFCSADTVEPFNPKVVQASMGAVLRVPVSTLDLDKLVKAVPDWPIMGAVLDGEDIRSASLPERGLLLIGNESEGLRPEASRHLGRRLTIPRHPGGGAESLNAAVATGILCAWLRRSGPGLTNAS